MLCAESMTCSPQLPEYLTVRNSQKQQQTIAKAAGLRTPFKANFQSVEFSERAEILLFAGENVALKLNR